MSPRLVLSVLFVVFVLFVLFVVFVGFVVFVWFVCLSVRLSVRPFVVVLFGLLFLAGFWVLQSVGPCVWSGWRCADSPGTPCKGSSA